MQRLQEKSKKEAKKEPEKPKTFFARFKVLLNETFRPAKKDTRIAEDEKFMNWTMKVDRDEW